MLPGRSRSREITFESASAHKKSKTQSNAIRFGILGCAHIARKNVRAIALSPLCVLVAIASRDIKKAEAFAQDCLIDTSVCTLYASYQTLLDDPNIDAVYIPLPTTLHLEWVVKAATAKKHVLCEKPVAISVADMRLMMHSCVSNGVQLMDGLMFMHHPRFNSLLQLLDDPFTGHVTRVDSVFSFKGNEDFFKTNIRCSAAGDPYGALGDLGWYCIRFGILVFSGLNANDLIEDDAHRRDWKLRPSLCSARCYKWTDDGVPLEAEVKIGFRGRGEEVVEKEDWMHSLNFYCSFLHPMRQTAQIIVSGNNQSICDKIINFDDFVIPRSPAMAEFYVETHPLTGPFQELDCRMITQKDVFQTTHVIQEAELFTTFARLVLEKSTSTFWPKMTMLTQEVLEACMQSIRSEGALVPIIASFNEDM